MSLTGKDNIRTRKQVQCEKAIEFEYTELKRY